MSEEKKTVSLADRLKQSTEMKSPGATKEKTENNTSFNTGNSRVGPMWNSDDDFEKVDDTEIEGEKKETEEGKPGKSDKEKTHVEKQASAETATALLESSLSMLCHPLIKYQLKKNFTKEEWKHFKSIQFEDPANLEPDQLKFYNKVKRLNKEYQSKLEKVDFSEAEIRRYEKSFYSYCDITNQTIGPGWLIAFNLFNAITNRAIEVFVKD